MKNGVLDKSIFWVKLKKFQVKQKNLKKKIAIMKNKNFVVIYRKKIKVNSTS